MIVVANLCVFKCVVLYVCHAFIPSFRSTALHKWIIQWFDLFPLFVLLPLLSVSVALIFLQPTHFLPCNLHISISNVLDLVYLFRVLSSSCKLLSYIIVISSSCARRIFTHRCNCQGIKNAIGNSYRSTARNIACLCICSRRKLVTIKFYLPHFFPQIISLQWTNKYDCGKVATTLNTTR